MVRRVPFLPSPISPTFPDAPPAPSSSMAMLLRALVVCLLASTCNAFGLALSRASTHSRASALRMSESGPNPVLGVASLGMGLIKPIFKAEAAIQATVLVCLTVLEPLPSRLQINLPLTRASSALDSRSAPRT